MAVTSRFLKVTQGNLNNCHLYLREVLDLFPPEVVGGRNQAHAALRTVRVLFRNGAVETDIDGTKNSFRKRRWLARFFKESGIQVGDRVLLEQLAPYVYQISKVEAPPTAASAASLAAAGPARGNNGRRAGRAAAEVAPGCSARDSIVHRDRFSCQGCGKRTRGQVHHILSRSQGGSDAPANLITLCGRCHMVVSPIPVPKLCGYLGLDERQLLAAKAKVEIAIHTQVLARVQQPDAAPKAYPPVSSQSIASAASPVMPVSVPDWKRLRPRAGAPWSKEEDAALLADVDAGLPVEEIARRRQRGIHAVQVRLFKLGHGH
jgi:hypothetical protein